jgi:hypothetical protein
MKPQHSLRKIGSDRPGLAVAMFLGASETLGHHHRDRQAARDRPTCGKPLLETGGENCKNEPIRIVCLKSAKTGISPLQR